MIAGIGAKKSAKGATENITEGFNTLTAGSTEKQKEQHARAIDRNAAFEQKKKDREERKKKLQSQWEANKKT